VKTLPEGTPVLIGIGSVFGAVVAAHDMIEPEQFTCMFGA
jgi:hypothetical protein